MAICFVQFLFQLWFEFFPSNAFIPQALSFKRLEPDSTHQFFNILDSLTIGCNYTNSTCINHLADFIMIWFWHSYNWDNTICIIQLTHGGQVVSGDRCVLSIDEHEINARVLNLLRPPWMHGKRSNTPNMLSGSYHLS